MPEVQIKRIIFSLFVISTIILNSCNALRENPLDPNSSDNLLGTIKGTVQTYSLPYTPLANVEVLWKPGNILSFTDTSGNFTISNVKTVNGDLIFYKDGFHADTVHINWAGTRKLNKQVNLNAFPVLDSLSIYTVVINAADTNSQMYELVIDTKVKDVDNDIDSVFVVNDQIGLSQLMDFNVADKTYQSILTLVNLNLNDIEETIGLQFDFRVINILGEVNILRGGSVTRVIKTRLTGLQPDNDQVINTFPINLHWNSYSAGYPFHFMVELYTNDLTNPQLVLRQDNIPSQDTSFTVDSLDINNYWWVVWIKDNFNNMSRSAPATFVIQ